jgi:hypothetical protein
MAQIVEANLSDSRPAQCWMKPRCSRALACIGNPRTDGQTRSCSLSCTRRRHGFNIAAKIAGNSIVRRPAFVLTSQNRPPRCCRRARLKNLAADLSPDKAILQDINAKNGWARAEA